MLLRVSECGCLCVRLCVCVCECVCLFLVFVFVYVGVWVLECGSVIVILSARVRLWMIINNYLCSDPYHVFDCVNGIMQFVTRIFSVGSCK